MFKLPNKHKSQKSRERFDFKFSNFRALQVPRGWDKLVVTVVSSETGKSVAKTGRATVREGVCPWTDSVLFSTPASGCQFKFVVASGSSKTGGFLGEAVVELGSYSTVREAVPIAVPLQKCKHGTVLQVEIQCLTPREKPRESWEDMGSFTENLNNDFDDMQRKLDISGSSDGSNSRKSFRSASNHSDGTSQTGEPLPMDVGFSALLPRSSIDSTEGSQYWGSNLSRSSSAAISNDIGRQDSTGSQSCSPHRSSSHSSFYSKISVSHDHLKRDVFDKVPHSVASSPLRDAGSSKDLLEAAEVTIQEVRAEARMWEQNARKLMTNLESVQTGLQEQSKHQTLLEKELLESRRECDGFKDEAEQLKILMAEAKMKYSGLKEVENVQRELENELKFQREEKANLALQLKKTQESNIELVSILQELEDTIEQQKIQIANMSRTQSISPDGEKNSHLWLEKESRNLALKDLQLQELDNLETSAMTLDRSLQDGNQEMELEQSLKTQASKDCDSEWGTKLAVKKEESIKLEAKLSKSLDEICIKDDGCNLNREIVALKIKVEELEKDCNELTNENLLLLFQLKESKRDVCPCGGSVTSETTRNEYMGNDALSTSDYELRMIKSQMFNLEDELMKETLVREIFTLCLDMQCLDLHDKFANLELQLKTSKNRVCFLDGELSTYREREKELEAEIASLGLHQQMGAETESKDHEYHCMNSSSESHSHSAAELAEMLSQLYEQILIVLTNIKKQQYTNDSIEFTGCHYSCSKLQSSTFEDSCDQNIRAMAILENFLQLKDLFEKASLSSCDDELQHRAKVAILADCNSELEACGCSEINSSNSLVFPENLEMKYKSDENSQVLTSKILLMKLSEMETCNTELEVHFSELAKENVGLLERISGLEAQLGYWTDERELINLELQHSESCFRNLVEEITLLKCKKEEQEADMKRKLQEMKKQLLESQGQCDHLKVANTKLQATAESLIDECSLLQKSNGELREQKRDLHKHSMVLEGEHRELKEAYGGIFKAVEALEGKYSLLLEEIASKDRAFLIELDSLLYENQRLEEKFEVQERLVNQVNVKMVGEIKKPERMVAHFSDEMSTAHNVDDLTAINSGLDLSSSCVEKVVVESTQWQSKKSLKLSLSTPSTLWMESERKQLILADEHAALKQNHEILMADHENLLELLEDVKSSEGKHKRLLRSLQLKLEDSEYEKLQVKDEISRLKSKLHKTTVLEVEIRSLQRALNEVKFENQRVEASFEMLCGEYEELMAEKALRSKKIASLESAVSEVEECKHRKAALEAKVLRLEGDLTAKEALSAQNAELRNELSQVKRANNEFQRKLRFLEEEMLVYQEGAKIVEELNYGKDAKQHRRQLTDEKFSLGSESLVICASALDKLELPKVDARKEKCDGRSIAKAMDTSKIMSFENGLSEVLEANDTKKSKLQERVFSVEHSSVTGDHFNKLRSKDNKEDQYEGTSTSLERELKDLRERYLQMSLKYAEVEVEREQLMLTLKAINNGRKSIFP